MFIGDHAPRGVTSGARGSRPMVRDRRGCGHWQAPVPDADGPGWTFGCALGPALRPAAAAVEERAWSSSTPTGSMPSGSSPSSPRTLPREDAEDVAATAWAIAVRREVTGDARAYVWTVVTRLAWRTAQPPTRRLSAPPPQAPTRVTGSLHGSTGRTCSPLAESFRRLLGLSAARRGSSSGPTLRPCPRAVGGAASRRRRLRRAVPALAPARGRPAPGPAERHHGQRPGAAAARGGVRRRRRDDRRSRGAARDWLSPPRASGSASP